MLQTLRSKEQTVITSGLGGSCGTGGLAWTLLLTSARGEGGNFVYCLGLECEAITGVFEDPQPMQP